MGTDTVAAFQFEPVPGDVSANLARMDELLAEAGPAVEMAVFPELCVTGYDLDDAESLARPVPGTYTEELAALADAHETTVVAGIPERDGDVVYNDLVAVSGAGLQGTYRKQWLWGAETETFATGEDPTVFEMPFGRVGLAICYDLNFPEHALAYSEAGVDVLVVSSAWRTSFLEDWRLLHRARALDTTAYTVGSNHMGDQRGRDHAGHSLIAGPDGQIIAEAEETSGSVRATIDPEELARARDRNPVRRSRDR